MTIRSIRTGVLPVSVVVVTAPMAPRSTLSTTSHSEVTIGRGQLAFDVSGIAGFSVAPGTRLRATATGGVLDWAEGIVVSYDGTTVVIDTRVPVGRISGEGSTFDDWNIGVIGEPGEKGEIGERGPDGRPGPATIAVDPNTITSEPGNPAIVDNTGDDLNARLRFTIPRGAVGPQGESIKGDKGDTGTAATITIVGTTTLPGPGQAEVTNVGDAQDARLEFTIPAGGPQGVPGPPGPALAVLPPFDVNPSGELFVNLEPPLEVAAGKLTVKGRAFQ